MVDGIVDAKVSVVDTVELLNRNDDIKIIVLSFAHHHSSTFGLN